MRYTILPLAFLVGLLQLTQVLHSQEQPLSAQDTSSTSNSGGFPPPNGSKLVIEELKTPSVQSSVSTEKSHSIGVGLGLGPSFESSNFKALPGVASCCPGFDGGYGFGQTLFGLVNVPVGNKFSFDGRFGFRHLSTNLTSQEINQTFVGTLVPGRVVMEHTIDATFWSALFQTGFQYELTSKFNGGLGFIADIRFSNNYSTLERLLEPSDALYKTSLTKTRLPYEGRVDATSSMVVGMVANVDYELPLGSAPDYTLHPELTFQVPFTGNVGGVSWSTMYLNAGVSIRKNFFKELPPPPPIEPPTAPVIAEQPIAVIPSPSLPSRDSLDVWFDRFVLDSTGRVSSNNVEVSVRTFAARTGVPVLPYVFFDNNSSTIPSKYNLLSLQTRPAFDPNLLGGKDYVSIYYDVLNIIGLRMKNDPITKITLTGCNSNVGSEVGNTAISQARAESVQKYLSDVWDVDKSRVSIVARNLPADATYAKKEESDEENRRVEISSNNFNVIDPLFVSDTLVQSISSKVKFKPKVYTSVGVATWRMTLSQGSRVLTSFQGKDDPPAELTWDLAKSKKTLPRRDGWISTTLTVTDKNGQSKTYQQDSIYAKTYEMKDVKTDIFSLVLFNYNKSTLTDAHKRIARQINEKIRTGSKVVVTGFADNALGSSSYNSGLSYRRAQETSKILNSKNIQIQSSSTDDDLYPNDTPEGRFHCRTVRVKVENNDAR